MARLTLPQLERHLFGAADILRGKMDASDFYSREHGEDARNLALYGQENNGTTWAITKMNMILHGITNADIANADIANEDTPAAPPAQGRVRRAAALRPGDRTRCYRASSKSGS